MNQKWSRHLRDIRASTMRPRSTPPEQKQAPTPSFNPFASSPAAGTNPFGSVSPVATHPFGSAADLVDPFGTSIHNATAPAGPPEMRSNGTPISVRVAYSALWVAAIAALVSAGMGVSWLFELGHNVDTALHLDPTGTAVNLVGGYADDIQFWLISVVIGVGVVCAIGYSLVGVALRAGHRWPRWVGTVLAVLSLPMLFLGPLVVMVLFGVVAVIAMWTPAARRFARSAAGDPWTAST
ncbi:hypothetical protein FK535_06945 [Mycolicibacterium sp. 018/SC-01/001]|uniref:hypothetical protein n=1 Tax=Mycolicibacterium sp. 018/SC-01/001 TaxID=2592069 RepID=UPI0011806971|nr:hypothetical protein [Mycolicibacterium sp. 018/SC-01/001]TRW86204.1 hypothetical protein FK535_06945 [Mycolicibacterium sp. 018/SC-01/001]